MFKKTGWILIVGSGLLVAQIALAQSASSTEEAKGKAAVDASSKPAQLSTTATGSAEATAAADASRTREAIEKRAAKVSTEAKAKAQAQMETTAEKVDKHAEAQGNTVVASRLAAEFGVTAEALLAEKLALGVSWGQLMIAHSLDANATADVTVEQLFDMRSDGMGWGQIAAGLGLNLGSVVSSVNAEARVAQGLAKADGRVSAMRGEGARAGMHGGVTAGLGAQSGKVGVGAGAGVGIKIGH